MIFPKGKPMQTASKLVTASGWGWEEELTVNVTKILLE